MSFVLKNDPQRSAVAWLNFDIAPVNAFGRQNIHDFAKTLEDTAASFPDIRLLILSSQKYSPHKKRPIFCSGADQRERLSWSEQKIIEHVRFQRQSIALLRRIPQRVLCLVNGIAYGLGAEICAASDYVIALAKAEFCFPEAKLGLVPGAGGLSWAFFWSKDKKLARRYIENAHCFDRHIGKDLGLVDLCCSEDELDKHIDAECRHLAELKPAIQAELKASYLDSLDIEKAFVIEDKAYLSALRTKTSHP